MKKVILIAIFSFGIALILVAANYPLPKSLRPAPVLKPCVGYTIIEFGKAVNCHGDTVRLLRQNGFAELASENR